MKEILIITNYYPPETGAAANRIYHLANGLKNRQYAISVLTPLPNYPRGRIFDGYKGKFRRKDIENGIEVNRLWIYASNSKNKLLRLFSMLSYSVSLIRFFIFNKIPKVVIIQSPPLLVAFTALFFLRSKKRTLILNISDLWPLAGLELGAFKPNLSYRFLEKIERSNYKYANRILGQSLEIITHVKNIFPDKELRLYRNFPDFEYTSEQRYQTPEGKIKLVYAGLLGVAQGIFKLCNEMDYTKIEFHIIGTGPEKQDIVSFIQDHPDLPLYYHGELSRSELHTALEGYDLTIIPLLNRIYGSVPSKIFEYSKLGLPILYFGGGEGEDLVKQYKLGWVANPGDYDHLNHVLNLIAPSDLNDGLKHDIMKSANTHFNFNTQLDEVMELLS